MVITSRRAHTCPSLSLICLSFFLQLNKPQKKNSSLSLSLRRVIYTYILREEKKTKAFALHYKTRLLLFLLLRVLFLIFDHLLRAREKEKEGDILKRNSGIAIFQKLTCRASSRFLNAT